MTLPPIPAIGSVTPGQAAGPLTGGQAVAGTPAPGFADALRGGLQHVSGLEHQADAITQSVAAGGPAGIEDLMIATTKAQLGVDLLVQVRNRAVEAYQEIMRLPV